MSRVKSRSNPRSRTARAAEQDEPDEPTTAGAAGAADSANKADKAAGSAGTGESAGSAGPAGPTKAARAAKPGGTRQIRARQVVLLLTALACVIEVFGPPGNALADLPGLWLVIGAPTAVWYGVATRTTSTFDGALLVAVGFGLVTDMVALLGLNELLPRIAHDPRPLSTIPIAATLAGTAILLGAFLPEPVPGLFAEWRPRRSGVLWIGAAGLFCLALSVAGPVRINNGFGDGVSVAAMICVTALLIGLVAVDRLSVAATELGIYCGAFGLLLLTSLRGWLITGHDIQKEYYYYQLAFGWERWEVHTFSNAFNACLSITILPVAIAKLTTISGIYVFKAVIPAVFALAPVMIFRAVRNVAPRRIAVLSAVFFVMFPTYFTDMPYMGRQEIAFVLLGCGMLVVTDTAPRLRSRRIAFLVLMVGLALAHYSTTYVVIMVLGLGIVIDLFWRLGSWRRAVRLKKAAAGAQSRSARRHGNEHSFLVWWMLPIVAGFALLWAGPATGTAGQLKSTISIAMQETFGDDTGQAASSGTSFSVFGGATETDQQRLADYRAATIANSATARAKGGLLPTSMAYTAATPYVAAAEAPSTSFGRMLDSLGLDVSGLNSLGRNLAAYFLQLLIVLGLIAWWLHYRNGLKPVRDQISLTIGALGMLVLLTVVPQLSVDYSVLRAFQQGIYFFAPFMALGLLWMFSWLKRWTMPAVCAVTAALVLFLTGALPHFTGEYAAPLSLGNSGQYYDIYYPTVAEQTAANWLDRKVRASGSKSPSNVIQTDQYTFNRLQTVFTGSVKSNIYPTVLSIDAYTFLGAETSETGEVTVFYRGDLITYRYPMSLLNQVYNEIYASDGVEIYQ